MKKYILLILTTLALNGVQAQSNEKTLNRRYQTEIRDSLSNVILERQREMQRYAERTLSALPNNEKLYDESFIRVETDLLDSYAPDGTMHLCFVFRLSYNCKHLEGYTDDYPLGTFDVDSSNSARAICNLTEHFVSHMLNDIIEPGKEVETTIFSSADGTEFTTAVEYDGRYGDYRYCPVTFNGERLRVSVDRETGIRNNCQLAYIRAQGVRAYLEENIALLQRTVNNYYYVTQSYQDSVNTHYYRRSSIEIRVNDAFAKEVEEMQRRRMEDDYVDLNIPLTERRNGDTYVLIIANERYSNELIPDVPYALNDGIVDSMYFVRSLGVPERQVKILRNASKTTIEQEGIHWLTDLAQAVAVKGGEGVATPVANIVICYAGHGYTDREGVKYLVPNKMDVSEIESLQGKGKGGCRLFGKKKGEGVCDSAKYDIELGKKESARFAEQCIGIEELCNRFKGYPVKVLTMVVDASFDGKGRDGEPMVRSDWARRWKEGGKKARKSNMRADAVILYAAEGDKTAYAYELHKHGFLTYFLLKEIKMLKEDVFSNTYQDLYESIAPKVSKESALQNKWQELSGVAGGKWKEEWRKLKIKN